MKLYVFMLLCSLSFNVCAQTAPDSTAVPSYTTENIPFTSEGVTLEGTLFKPRNIRTAIVLVHGSGQEKRMMDLASVLAQHDIAVFTYDKRGVGKSGGVYAGPEAGTNNIDASNLKLLALDASNAAKTLRAHLPAKHVPLGLMGFSQAGWIIPLAAKENQHVSFMVLFSCPVVTTLEQLRFQFYTNGNTKFWETHSEAEVRTHVQTDPDRYQFSATDPRDALSTLSIRGLWIFGGIDIQIPVGLSTEHIDRLKEQGKPYTYRLFPALGHNTGLSKSSEPMDFALQWIKNFKNESGR